MGMTALTQWRAVSDARPSCNRRYRLCLDPIVVDTIEVIGPASVIGQIIIQIADTKITLDAGTKP